MLNGTRDAGGDVERGRHDLAGLAHLPVIGRVTGVHRGAAGAQCGAQLVGQGNQHLAELLAAAHRAAARDDDLGRRQFRPVVLGDLAAQERAAARIGHRGNHLDRCAATGGGGGVEAGGAHGDDLDDIAALHRGDGVAGVDRALEGVGAKDLGGFADLADVQQGGDSRRHVLAGRRGGEQQVGVAGCNRQHLGRQILGQAVTETFGVGMQHLGHANNLRGSRRGATGVVAGDQHMHVATAGQRGRDGVQRGALDVGVVVFSNDEDTHLRSPWLRS